MPSSEIVFRDGRAFSRRWSRVDAATRGVARVGAVRGEGHERTRGRPGPEWHGTDDGWRTFVDDLAFLQRLATS